MKNLSTVGGRSLMQWVAECLQDCNFIDQAVVSTDHPEIKRHSESVGLNCPFLRPEELSGDRVSDVDVLTHGLIEMERQTGDSYEIILMLQPTSPFRRAHHIRQACDKLITGGFDSVLSLSKTDPKNHPLKQLEFDGQSVSYFDEAGKSIIARQQLNSLYHRNGVVYALTRDCVMMQKAVIGERCSALIIDEPMPNIDALEDLVWAEYLLSRVELGPKS